MHRTQNIARRAFVMASKSNNEGPLFLWKETHPTLGWLSQWHESPFHTGDKTENPIVYRTAEQ